jgi:hypothetical protein
MSSLLSCYMLPTSLNGGDSVTFPKYAKFGLTVSVIGLLYEIYRLFAEPRSTANTFFIILGILATIVGILYFTHELRRDD